MASFHALWEYFEDLVELDSYVHINYTGPGTLEPGIDHLSHKAKLYHIFSRERSIE